jgi:hypothetical protein
MGSKTHHIEEDGDDNGPIRKNQKHSTHKVQTQYKHPSSYLTNVHGDKRDF